MVTFYYYKSKGECFMRLKSSLLAICLVVGLCGAQASAMTVNTNAVGVESVQPRAAQCGNCGAYMLLPPPLSDPGQTSVRRYNALNTPPRETAYNPERYIQPMTADHAVITRLPQVPRPEQIVLINVSCL